MAAPTIPILINADDIREYKPLSKNVDEADRIDQYIREAQVMDLKPILGRKLYYDFIENYTDAKYLDLLNGAEYDEDGVTVQFEGVKPILVYYSFARILQYYGSNPTRFGLVKKLAENSEPLSTKEIQAMISQAKAGAISYQDELFRFLNENTDTYPLWKGQKGAQRKRRRTVKINSVGRRNNNDFIDVELHNEHCGICGNYYHNCECH